jgi:hypothetical protein
MATDEAVQTAGMDDEADVVSMALADLDMPKPEQVENEPKSEETISDNSDETEEQADEDTADKDSTESDSEDDDSTEDDDKPADDATKDKVQRRIDKLVAKQRESEEKAQAVTSELEQLKQAKSELEAQLNQSARPVLSPTTDNPLANVETEDALDQQLQSAQAVRRWALQNSDGTTIKAADGSERFVSGEEVKDYLVKADDIITLHAPARRQWIAQRQESVETAKNAFPDMFKAGTPMNKAYQATVKQAPDLLRIPQHEYWVALALHGEAALMSAHKAKEARAAAEKKVSSKKSDSKTPTPVKPVSAPKSSTRGGSSAKLSGTSLEDIQDWVADSILT